jgi:hypothetical protein
MQVNKISESHQISMTALLETREEVNDNVDDSEASLLAQLHLSFQEELIKTSSAFQKFMREMQKRMRDLSQENILLCKQLSEWEERKREREEIWQKENQTSLECIHSLATQLKETNRCLAGLESSNNSLQEELKTVNQSDLKSLLIQQAELKSHMEQSSSNRQSQVNMLHQQIISNRTLCDQTCNLSNAVRERHQEISSFLQQYKCIYDKHVHKVS